MISLQLIKKKFGKQQVLSGISLDFTSEQPVALVGPNGSGKTTLIKCILGLVKPDSGNILFKGLPVGNDFEYRRYLGYMPQSGRFPEQMTVGQVFTMVKDLRRDATNLDDELMVSFRLTEIFHKRIYALSGGMRQKVSAALTFLFQPEVLILDEPTAGLDPAASEILKEKVLKEIGKGKLLIVTSHNLADLEELTTRLVYLVDGSCQFDGSLDGLKSLTGQQKLSRAIAKISSNWSPKMTA